MKRSLTRRFRLTAVLVGVAMVALACGGDEGDGGGGDGELSGASFTVGSKEFTEQLILGQITLQALEDAGASVTDQTGITGTTNVRQALTSGEIDMYWEYTGTGWAELLGNEIADAPTDEGELFETVAEQDLSENNVKWLALAPVNNTYAIATSQATSEEFGVQSLSDYAELANDNPADASLCAASEFIDRGDGLPGLEETYGFDLPESALTEVDLGIVFTRVPQGEPCKFGEVFATDGRIPANDMVVLEDDESFFVIYNLAMTVRNDVYEQHPELEDVFTPIAEKLTTEELQQLNAQVDVDGLPVDQVAQRWLEDNDFIG
ncbi:MAG TPA: glycine betaine ABC transporter substrate-binding protein [Nocardioidaceae bacterium]|nr:glycine betaine ABC transporter substrate-binding protein [Nocardioidaceae bacterium]